MLSCCDRPGRSACCDANVVAPSYLPMFMKSDLYWQVMPKPKSLQKPVSFLITYGERNSKSEGAHGQKSGSYFREQLERELFLNLSAT